MSRMPKRTNSSITDGQTAERPRRKRRVLRILIASLIIIAVGFALFRVSLRLKLRAKLRAISAAGYPVTCAELDKWYTIPESADNAAGYLMDAFSDFDKWGRRQVEELASLAKGLESIARMEPLAPETKALIIQYLADNQEALKLLHEGAAVEHSRYPIELSKGYEATLPHLSGLATGVRLLEVEAAWHAENAEPQLAIRSITSILGLARSVSKEPVLLSQYVRQRYQVIAVSTLEHVINKTEFTDEQLAVLAQAFVDAQDHSGTRRGIVGQRCATVALLTMPAIEMSQTIESIYEGKSPSPFGAFVRDLPSALSNLLSALPFAFYRFAGLADMEAINYLNLMEAYIGTTKLALHQQREAVDAVAADLGAKSKFRILPSELPLWLSRFTRANMKTIGRLRAAEASLAVLRYRVATGSLPDSLAELVPTYLDAVPKDPFDGKDVRYKRLETGFVVYSIGEDGKDDGGMEESPEETGVYVPTADVTFIIQR